MFQLRNILWFLEYENFSFTIQHHIINTLLIFAWILSILKKTLFAFKIVLDQLRQHIINSLIVCCHGFCWWYSSSQFDHVKILYLGYFLFVLLYCVLWPFILIVLNKNRTDAVLTLLHYFSTTSTKYKPA